MRSEPLCRACFVNYVLTKAIKRMEPFRVRHAAADKVRKLLLPVSFGFSSLALLHILDHHLKNQTTKTGRTGFALAVLHVDDSAYLEQDAEHGNVEELRSRYPNHGYASVPLHHVLDEDVDDGVLSSLGADAIGQRDAPAPEQLDQLLMSLPSYTARGDVVSILRTKLIVGHATRLGCEAVLWGDSTTKLAEKTLAETAKGRGSSLPWQIADGTSSFGIAFHYPLRDLLKKELVDYVGAAELPLSLLVRRPNTTVRSVSSKKTTIDDLMRQYFDSVEDSFPNIVSNVVRTVGKLESGLEMNESMRCSLCKMPARSESPEPHGREGDRGACSDASSPSACNGGRPLCYGCRRSIIAG